MGKAKKFKPSQVAKNVALADQIESVKNVKSRNRIKERNRHDDDEEVSYLKFSRRYGHTCVQPKSNVIQYI